MNNRVKEVRKALDLSQEEFGKKLGVSRGVVVNVELNRAEIKPLFIDHLCSIFNVNRMWLLNGNGSMFVETEKTLISQLSDEYSLDVLDRKMIESYVNLDSGKRKVIKEYLRSIVDAVMSSEQDYSEYREDYISERAMPFAARSGDDTNLKEAQDEYDGADDGEEDI